MRKYTEYDKNYQREYMRNRLAWLKFKGGEKYEEYKKRRREWWKTYQKQKRTRRKQIKEKLIIEFGGKCQACGYDKCLWALTFHHKNNLEKKFSISMGICKSYAYEKLLKEAEKCELLCANCHFEHHFKKDDFGMTNKNKAPLV